MKKLKITGIILTLLIITLYIVKIRINSFQRNGEINLKGLSSPVNVVRDEKGMPYIYASSLEDAYLAQGFITAQDRLFSMEVTRLLAKGRLSELAGARTKDLDVQMRTLGIFRNAVKWAKMISHDDRKLLEAYVDGINQYISDRTGEHPVEFFLAGIKPEKWGIEDALAIINLLSWNCAGNVKTKIVALMLTEKLGVEKALEIFPLSTNPDDDVKKGIAKNQPKAGVKKMPDKKIRADMDTRFSRDGKILAFLDNSNGIGMGSNNWAVGSSRSAGGKPVLANDPHQESYILPGLYHPLGIIIPGQRAVGITLPGIPGIIIGRNSGLAFGVTNSYNDAQDLYIETIDPENPENYLEGKKSLPFESIKETIKVRDKKTQGGFLEEKITILLTRRGPVISGTAPDLKTKKVVTLRWSSFENMEGGTDFLRDYFMAKSVTDFRNFLKKVHFIMLNWVFADDKGNIGWQTSGRIPIRSQGDSTLPFVVKDGIDNWKGWIPFDRMPQEYNPERGWLGTSNHRTVKGDYPYYISSHFAPYYRYGRLRELLTSKEKFTPDDHWNFQRDTKNLMAKKIAPIMAEALLIFKDTESIGMILKNWDFFDGKDKAAPALFHSIYRKFALLVFEDELGEHLARAMLDVWYFWEERLERMVLRGDSPWFDNTFTSGKETMNDIFHRAAILAVKEGAKKHGTDTAGWAWGDMHGIEFLSPIALEGPLRKIFGGGRYPMSGSGETLYRALYYFSKSFRVKVSSTLRMVADLSDNDKVAAVIPGGASGRIFDNHNMDQVRPYMSGEKVYWWFSDDIIKRQSRSALVLNPGAR